MTGDGIGADCKSVAPRTAGSIPATPTNTTILEEQPYTWVYVQVSDGVRKCPYYDFWNNTCKDLLPLDREDAEYLLVKLVIQRDDFQNRLRSLAEEFQKVLQQHGMYSAN